MSKPKKPRALPALTRPTPQPKSTPSDPDAGMLPSTPPPSSENFHNPLAGMSKEAIERMMGDQSDISFEDDN